MGKTEKLKFLAEQYEARNVVTFFGAGASISSGLPIAWQIVEAILIHLCQHLPAYRSETVTKIKSLSSENKLPRFEMLVSRLTSNCGEGAYKVLDIFETAAPNPSHIVISQLINNKYQDIHFTTNFDNLLELAGCEEHGSIYEPEDVDGSRIPRIVHLHGGSSNHHRDFTKIISTIDGILFPLPNQFRTLLEAELKKKIIVLVGYSGEDDDIRPILESFSDKNRIWTINPSVKVDSNIFRIVGSMERVIEDTSDNALLKIYQHLLENNPNLKEIFDLTPNAEFTSRKVNELLHARTQELEPYGCILVLLESLLDAGDTNLYETITRSLDLDDVDRFGLLSSLFEATQNSKLRAELTSVFLPTYWKELPPEKLVGLASSFVKISSIENALIVGKRASEVAQIEKVSTYLRAKLLFANLLVFYETDTGDKTLAITEINHALSIASAYPDMKASLLNTKGVALQRTEASFEEVLACYEEALAAAMVTQVPSRACKVLVNLSELYRTNPNSTDKTIKYLQQARAIAEVHNLFNVIAHTFSGMLLSYTSQGQWSKVKQEIEAAHIFLSSHSVPAQVRAGTLIDIGVAYIGLKEYVLAEQSCLYAIQIVEDELNGNLHRMTMAVANYLEAIARQEIVDEGNKYFRRAPEILANAISSKYSYGASWLAIAISKCFYVQKNILKAKEYIEMATDQNKVSQFEEVSEELEKLRRLMQ